MSRGQGCCSSETGPFQRVRGRDHAPCKNVANVWMSQQCVCKHRPQESSDSPTTQSFLSTHEDTEPKRRAAGCRSHTAREAQLLPSPYRDCTTGPRGQGPHAPASPGLGMSSARRTPAWACSPALFPGQGNPCFRSSPIPRPSPDSGLDFEQAAVTCAREFLLISAGVQHLSLADSSHVSQVSPTGVGV